MKIKSTRARFFVSLLKRHGTVGQIPVHGTRGNTYCSSAATRTPATEKTHHCLYRTRAVKCLDRKLIADNSKEHMIGMLPSGHVGLQKPPGCQLAR